MKTNNDILEENFPLNDSSTWPKTITGIYAIFSKTTNKCYVGLTKHNNGFNGRWNDHRGLLRNGEHDNPYLQHSYDKHGELDFYLKIIEITEPSITKKDLELKEWGWIDKLKSLYFQNGWNIDTHERYQTRKVSYRPSYVEKLLNFEFIAPDGNIVRGKNLKKFALENGLCAGNLNKLFHGKSAIYKGYKSTNPDFHAKTKIHKLISPSGELYEFDNVPKFANEHNLNDSNLYSLLNYNMQHYKKWYVPDVLQKLNCVIDHPARVHKVVNTKTFAVHEFKDIAAFCLKYNIAKRGLLNIIQLKFNPNCYKINDWSSILTPFKAVKKEDIIYKFIWSTEIAKTLKVSSTTINRTWKTGSSNRIGIFKANPFPMPIIKEDF
jgi:group I intron endonuclease